MGSAGSSTDRFYNRATPGPPPCSAGMNGQAARRPRIVYACVVHRHGDRAPALNLWASAAAEADWASRVRANHGRDDMAALPPSADVDPAATTPLHTPPAPWGLLTTKGRGQLRRVGETMRRVYADLLEEEGPARRVGVLSTNYSRTMW